MIQYSRYPNSWDIIICIFRHLYRFNRHDPGNHVYWPSFPGFVEPAIQLLEDVVEPYTINTDVPARVEALGQTEPVFACPVADHYRFSSIAI